MSELQESLFRRCRRTQRRGRQRQHGVQLHCGPQSDSLDVVELVMKLEETFGIEIPEDQAESIQTVGQAIEFIESKQNG